MNWIMFSKEEKLKYLSPSTSKHDGLWKLGLHRDNQVKIKLLVWIHIHYDFYHIKMGNFGKETNTQRHK